MVRIVLDVNCVRGILLSEPKTSDVFSCILDKGEEYEVVICDTVENAYFDHLEKWSLGFNVYHYIFKQHILRSGQLIEMESKPAPDNFIHDDDQGIYDCIFTSEADITVTADCDFNNHERTKFDFENLTCQEFLERICPEYVLKR